MQSYGLSTTPKLEEMIGKTVLALVPAMHATNLLPLKLHAVEDSGIWVEHTEFTQELLANAGLDPAERKLIFLPYVQVKLLLQTAAPVPHHDLWHKS
jgi:hypothetical protein